VGGNGTPRHILLPTTGGPHRGLQVKDSETSLSGEETEEQATSSSSTRMGTMSLEYAAKCLRNCLFLLRAAALPVSPLTPSNPSSISSPSPETNNRPSTPPSPSPSSTSPPGSPSSSSSTTNGTSAPTFNPEMIDNDMRQAALANLSFVSLALANPVVALTSALELLSLPTHTEVYKYLAHVYAAESLCMLGRASEAIDHLSPSIIDDLIPPNSSVSPLQGTHSSPYSSLTSHSQPLSAVARNMLYTNLACAHILRDDLAQAQACIAQALTHQPSSTKALLLQVYLELRKGNNDIALELLKRGRPFPKRKTKR
jgi:tetratricopeptide (TPR) repeat protein